MPARNAQVAQVGRRKIELSNLTKVLFPDDDIVKAQLIEYYFKMAPTILAHLKGRPLSLVRYPDGISGESFFQKQRPDWAPEWLKPVFRRVTSDRLSTDALVAEMNETLKLPGVTNAWTMPIKARIDMLTTGIRTPVGIKIYGADIAEIERLGTAIEANQRDGGEGQQLQRHVQSKQVSADEHEVQRPPHREQQRPEHQRSTRLMHTQGRTEIGSRVHADTADHHGGHDQHDDGEPVGS